VLGVFVDHYNGHSPHRVLSRTPPNPTQPRLLLVSETESRSDSVQRRDRLGGLIREYRLAA
jgi:hypothetical protein